MGTLCTALFNVFPKVSGSIASLLTQSLPMTWLPSLRRKEKLHFKKPPDTKVLILSLSIQPHLGRKQASQSKALLQGQE